MNGLHLNGQASSVPSSLAIKAPVSVPENVLRRTSKTSKDPTNPRMSSLSDLADAQHDGDRDPFMLTMVHKVTETFHGYHLSDPFAQCEKAIVPEVSGISAITSIPAPPAIPVVSATSDLCELSWNPDSSFFRSQPADYISTKSAADLSTLFDVSED